MLHHKAEEDTTVALQALLSRLGSARSDYEQAAADFLDAVKRYGGMTLGELEKQELLRVAKEREEMAFAKYKETVDAISCGDAPPEPN